jgi:metallo-beta-lactamase family protein
MMYHSMKLTFWGAAGTVTGSMHLVESGGRRYLLDCGLFQGRRKDADRINRNLPFPASSIDAVILSHAHIDHCGNLPTLVRNGFSGPIFTTPATVDLCNWMLRDTAHIQEKDAEFVNKRLEKRKNQ